MSLPEVFEWILRERGILRYPDELTRVFERVLHEARNLFICCMCNKSAIFSCGHCHARNYCSLDCQMRDCDKNQHHVTCRLPRAPPSQRRLTLSEIPVDFKATVAQVNDSDSEADEDEEETASVESIDEDGEDEELVTFDFMDYLESLPPSKKRKREDNEEQPDRRLKNKSTAEYFVEEEKLPIFEIIYNVLLESVSDSPELMLAVHLLSQVSRAIHDNIGREARALRFRVHLPMHYRRFLFTGVLRSHSVDLVLLYANVFNLDAQRSDRLDYDSPIGYALQRFGYETTMDDTSDFAEKTQAYLLQQKFRGVQDFFSMQYIIDGRLARAIDKRDMDAFRDIVEGLDKSTKHRLFEQSVELGYGPLSGNTFRVQAVLTAIQENDVVFVNDFFNYFTETNMNLHWIGLTGAELALLSQSDAMDDHFRGFLRQVSFMCRITYPSNCSFIIPETWQRDSQTPLERCLIFEFIRSIADFRYTQAVMNNRRLDTIIKNVFHPIYSNSVKLGNVGSIDSLLLEAPSYASLVGFLTTFKPVMTHPVLREEVSLRKKYTDTGSVAFFMANPNLTTLNLMAAFAEGGMFEGINLDYQEWHSHSDLYLLIESKHMTALEIEEKILPLVDIFSFARIPRRGTETVSYGPKHGHVDILRKLGYEFKASKLITAFMLYMIHRTAGTLTNGIKIAEEIDEKVLAFFLQFERAAIQTFHNYRKKEGDPGAFVDVFGKACNELMSRIHNDRISGAEPLMNLPPIDYY